MNETINMPLSGEEIESPQTSLLLEDIDSRLSAEEVGVLTEGGRINKQGRKIADSVYQDFLERSNGDYKQILELCREAEFILDIGDTDSRDNESFKIIQSIRGKIIYNTYRTWVEKQMNFEAYGMGDLSATSVMKYARILRADKKIDVYEEATNIEKERKRISEQLRAERERLGKKNEEIIEEDIGGSIEDIPIEDRKPTKTKLGDFTRNALEPTKRKRTVAAVLSTLVVVGITLGCVANTKNSKLTDETALQTINKPQIAQVEKMTEIITSELEGDLERVLTEEYPDIDVQSLKEESRQMRGTVGITETEMALPLTVTPPSLMLHSANLYQLDELIPLLDKYKSITYEDYYEALKKGENIENPLLISIDDLGTSWLRRDFRDMTKKLTEAGMVGTLAINTDGTREEAKEDIWIYLNELKDAGWEIAIHTEGHLNLPVLTNDELRYQIEETYYEILEHTGEAPKTLILPFGSIDNPQTDEPDQRIFDICRELGIVWIVGIQGGKSFEGEGPFLIGRIPPHPSAEITVDNLEKSFGPQKLVPNN